MGEEGQGSLFPGKGGCQIFVKTVQKKLGFHPGQHVYTHTQHAVPGIHRLAWWINPHWVGVGAMNSLLITQSPLLTAKGAKCGSPWGREPPLPNLPPLRAFPGILPAPFPANGLRDAAAGGWAGEGSGLALPVGLALASFHLDWAPAGTCCIPDKSPTYLGPARLSHVLSGFAFGLTSSTWTPSTFSGGGEEDRCSSGEKVEVTGMPSLRSFPPGFLPVGGFAGTGRLRQVEPFKQPVLSGTLPGREESYLFGSVLSLFKAPSPPPRKRGLHAIFF